MANRLKSPKPEKPDPDKLKPEKEETVVIKHLVKDERTWKILGTASLFISIFLFVSFVSYFFTWKEDQDKIFQGVYPILITDEVKVSNLMGGLGAFVAHFFIYKGFGLASLLICTFFFIVGINLLFNRKVFSIWRNLRYVVLGLLIFSVMLDFIFQKSDFSYGGAVGELISNWLLNVIGSLGTAVLLFVLVLSFIIWQFNPVFNLPKRKLKEQSIVPASDEEAEFNTAQEEVSGSISNGNKLRSGSGIVVILPNENVQNNPLTDFKVVERNGIEMDDSENILSADEEMEETTFLTAKGNQGKNAKPVPDIELEVKSTSEEELDIEGSRSYEHLPNFEPTLDLRDYKYPSLNLLESYGGDKIVQDVVELEKNKNQIINTLLNYDIAIKKISATIGPTVTLYEIVPADGVRISRIKNLEDDIALSLAALGIRIVAPIPGKGTIGIEVPNMKKSIVSMKTLLASEKFQNNNYSLPIAIGKKIDNENFIVDLVSMPHLLMAGATGQGKSVGINAILVSLLYKKHPSQLKFVLIDPKKVELSVYRLIERHFLAKLPGEDEAIITDTKKVVHTLNALCIEMDNRYDLLKEAGARNIKEYNEKFVKRKLNPQKGHQFLPFIVLVIDEFADLIMTAGKEIEMPIARLAQVARAVGIHLIIATQRPSVNIITGTIKANFPSRIAFKVSSKIDSRTILDTGGAEQLIGKGDMLISHHGEITRLQCAFVDTPEVEKIVDYIGKQRGYANAFLLPEYVDEKEMDGKDFDLASGERDSLFEDAARLIVQNQTGSTSLIQRRMKLGYNRAGRLMDQLESAGIVGPSQGSKVRDVLVKTEADLENYLNH